MYSSPQGSYIALELKGHYYTNSGGMLTMLSAAAFRDGLVISCLLAG